MRPNRSAIKAIREAQGQSFGDIERKTEGRITKPHLWRVEKGLAGIGDDKLADLADALGVEVDAITHDTPQETP